MTQCRASLATKPKWKHDRSRRLHDQKESQRRESDDRRTHHLHGSKVTLPAHVIAYDETVIDALPSSLDFDESLSAECTSGCTTPETTVIPQTYSPKVLGSSPFTTTVAWYLGDIESDAVARTINAGLQGRCALRAPHRRRGNRGRQ